MDKRIDMLSGGEKSRVVLATILARPVNLLILDEPTNHLDIEGREALEEGLSDFGGTILAVSHDRWFLEKVAERIIVMEQETFTPYEGTFSEYWRDVGARNGRSSGRIERRGAAVARPRKTAPPAREKDSKEARRLALEARIDAEERRKADLERLSLEANAAREFAKAGRAVGEAAAIGRTLAKLYAEWEGILD